MGLTVIENDVVDPLHEIPPPENTEVTFKFPVIGVIPLLVATKGEIFPVPFETNPIAELEFVQV